MGQPAQSQSWRIGSGTRTQVQLVFGLPPCNSMQPKGPHDGVFPHMQLWHPQKAGRGGRVSGIWGADGWVCLCAHVHMCAWVWRL